MLLSEARRILVLEYLKKHGIVRIYADCHKVIVEGQNVPPEIKTEMKEKVKPFTVLFREL